jgi:hypothetical protein
MFGKTTLTGTVPLTNGSGSGSNSGSDRLLSSLILRMQKKSHFFLITCLQVHHLQSNKFNFLLKSSSKMLFCRHYFSLPNTFMRKREGSGAGSGSAPLTNGSGSGSWRPNNMRIPNTGDWLPTGITSL